MAEAVPAPEPARISAGNRIALAVVWLLAAVPVALWIVHRDDPELAVVVAQHLWTWTVRLLLGGAVLFAVAALLFPPVPAWLRLRWHDVKLAATSNRGPLLKALSELRHFESAQRHFEVGRLALLRRDLAIALPHLQRAIALDPDVAAAHHQFGLCLLRIGQIGAAAAEFAYAERLEPGHAFGDSQLYLGRCLDLAGRHAEAAAILTEHAAQHGGGRRSGYWRGQALQNAGDAAGAREAFAQAAAAPTQRLSAEENWVRALARVRTWRGGTP
jgi:tetratricopeptide (TPR) repeat protein